MMMVELTTVLSAVLPVDELADHLRLSRGFADDGDQDTQLESCLRAAASAIEARIGKALFERRFLSTVTKWNRDTQHVLPVAPVRSVDSVRLVSRAGSETVLDPESYDLLTDTHRPALVAAGANLPSISPGGSAEIEFTAGYAADWATMPADLKQAVLIQAGTYYGQNIDAEAGIPIAVSILIEPYRPIRMRGASA